MTVSVLPIFAATVAGAGVGALAAKKNKTKGALVGGGLGLVAGLIVNSLAGSFGSALGSGIGGAQAAAGLVPIIAAKKQGVAGGCSKCVKARIDAPKVTSLGVADYSSSNSNSNFSPNSSYNSSSNSDITRDSCLECTEKHLGAALILITEVRDGYAEHRLRAIGHLHEAEDESQAWPELHDAVRAARKSYQSDNITPDFKALAELAQGVRNNAPANTNGVAA